MDITIPHQVARMKISPTSKMVYGCLLSMMEDRPYRIPYAPLSYYIAVGQKDCDRSAEELLQHNVIRQSEDPAVYSNLILTSSSIYTNTCNSSPDLELNTRHGITSNLKNYPSADNYEVVGCHTFHVANAIETPAKDVIQKRPHQLRYELVERVVTQIRQAMGMPAPHKRDITQHLQKGSYLLPLIEDVGEEEAIRITLAARRELPQAEFRYIFNNRHRYLAGSLRSSRGQQTNAITTFQDLQRQRVAQNAQSN